MYIPEEDARTHNFKSCAFLQWIVFLFNEESHGLKEWFSKHSSTPTTPEFVGIIITNVDTLTNTISIASGS